MASGDYAMKRFLNKCAFFAFLAVSPALVFSAQPSEIYVDPSIAADSGTGTIGDPYGDLEYAIEQTTHDTTNGTRVNIKAGATETLAASLEAALADTVTTVAWTCGESDPCVFQGYTATAGDGGIGVISGGGSVSIYVDAANGDYVSFINLNMNTVGANPILVLDNFSGVLFSELHSSTGTGNDAIVCGAGCTIVGNYIHDIQGVGIDTATSNNALIAFNYFENEGVNDFSIGIRLQENGGNVVLRNIFDLDGASDGIRAGQGNHIIGNSIYSNAGTGQGIQIDAGQGGGTIINNLVEGFSGTGGVCIDLDASAAFLHLYGGNAAYNCENEYTTIGDYTVHDMGDNETLSASPFTSASTDDFNPVDTGNVKQGATTGAKPDDADAWFGN
jgi:hypothetical protein